MVLKKQTTSLVYCMITGSYYRLENQNVKELLKKCNRNISFLLLTYYTVLEIICVNYHNATRLVVNNPLRGMLIPTINYKYSHCSNNPAICSGQCMTRHFLGYSAGVP